LLNDLTKPSAQVAIVFICVATFLNFIPKAERLIGQIKKAKTTQPCRTLNP